MLPINAQEVTDIQTEWLGIMTQTGTVTRPGSHGDGAGGLDISGGYVAQSPTISCAAFPDKMIPTLSNEDVEGAHVMSEGDWSLMVPVGTDIRLRDRVIVGSITLEVTGGDAGRINPPFLAFKCAVVAGTTAGS